MLGVIVLAFSIKGRFIYVDCFERMRLRAGSVADINFVLSIVTSVCCQNVKARNRHCNSRNDRKDKFNKLTFHINHLKVEYYIVKIIGCQVHKPIGYITLI